jgi:hypothetical protein
VVGSLDTGASELTISLADVRKGYLPLYDVVIDTIEGSLAARERGQLIDLSYLSDYAVPRFHEAERF